MGLAMTRNDRIAIGAVAALGFVAVAYVAGLSVRALNEREARLTEEAAKEAAKEHEKYLAERSAIRARNAEPPPPPKVLSAREAFAAARPTDMNELDLGPGVVSFVLWARSHLRWSDLSSPEKISVGQVMKDSAMMRGRVACYSGDVIEIRADRSVSPPVFHGGMSLEDFSIVRFTAVGDTGNIVANSKAKLCGFITGSVRYENAMGNISSGAMVVGMFDLPANRVAN